MSINKVIAGAYQLECVIVEGDQEITQLVKELEQEEIRRAFEESDNLPF